MSKTVFVPANPIERAIQAGDYQALLAALREMPLDERRACAPALRQLQKRIMQRGAESALWWGSALDYQHELAATLALFFVGDARERAAGWKNTDLMRSHLDILPPDVLRGLAADIVEGHPWAGNGAQRLVADGICERPDSDAYILGLMGILQFNMRQDGRLRQLVDDDPGLLDGTLLRLFDIEGTEEINLARIDKVSSASESWGTLLLELAACGKLERAALLEKTLAALERDWPQSRSGWYSQFHDRLAPGTDDMAPHAASYLRLCESRISPTVTLALNALAILLKSGALDRSALVEALAPVFSSAAKGQIEAALKLFDQVVKSEPSLAIAASSHASRALSHSAADVHKKVIARLSLWGVDDATRAHLQEIVPQVAAVHRDALAALAGSVPDQPVALAPLPPVAVAAPCDPSRRLAPPEDLDALIQTIARVLENDHLHDDLERAIEGIARMAPQLDAERERFSPVIKRARAVVTGKRPVAAALGRIVLFACKPAALPAASGELTAAGELSRRVTDVCALLATRSGLAPLSVATHLRGFIDPVVLVQRAGDHLAHGVVSSTGEQVRSLLRLAPGAAPDALRVARGLTQTPFVQALRYALGDDVAIGKKRALFAAAARIRHPGEDDARMLADYGDMGPDGPAVARYAWSNQLVPPHMGTFVCGFDVAVIPAAVKASPDLAAICRHTNRDRPWDYYTYGGRAIKLYASTVFPSSLDAFFSRGAFDIGNNLDWHNQRWDDQVYLEPLLDDATPASDSAIMLLAFALGAKESAQVALAVDALSAMLVDGRVQPQPVGRAIRSILLSGFAKASRYPKSLACVAKAQPAAPAAVVAVVCEVLDLGADAAPKDAGALLELLLELTLAHGLALPAGARETISLLKLTGKAKAAQQDLLVRLSIN